MVINDLRSPPCPHRKISEKDRHDKSADAPGGYRGPGASSRQKAVDNREAYSVRVILANVNGIDLVDGI